MKYILKHKQPLISGDCFTWLYSTPFADESVLFSYFSVTFQLLFSLPECAPFTDESAQWHHGAFFVNGFNVGRYHQVGPQKTLYVPGPLLKQGTNEVGISSTNVLPHSIKLVFSLYYLPIYILYVYGTFLLILLTWTPVSHSILMHKFQKYHRTLVHQNFKRICCMQYADSR